MTQEKDWMQDCIMQHRRGMMWGCRQRKQRGVNEEPRKSGGLGAGGVFGQLEMRDNTDTACGAQESLAAHRAEEANCVDL